MAAAAEAARVEAEAQSLALRQQFGAAEAGRREAEERSKEVVPCRGMPGHLRLALGDAAI